jgi:hypothetical protein
MVFVGVHGPAPLFVLIRMSVELPELYARRPFGSVMMYGLPPESIVVPRSVAFHDSGFDEILKLLG